MLPGLRLEGMTFGEPRPLKRMGFAAAALGRNGGVFKTGGVWGGLGCVLLCFPSFCEFLEGFWVSFWWVFGGFGCFLSFGWACGVCL